MRRERSACCVAFFIDSHENVRHALGWTHRELQGQLVTSVAFLLMNTTLSSCSNEQQRQDDDSNNVLLAVRSGFKFFALAEESDRCNLNFILLFVTGCVEFVIEIFSLRKWSKFVSDKNLLKELSLRKPGNKFELWS